MRIRIEGLDFTFQFLENYHKLRAIFQGQPSSEDEKFKDSLQDDDDDPVKELKKGGRFGYDAVQIDPPLYKVGFIAKRVGPLYSAEIVVISKDPEVFNGVSRNLARTLHTKGYRFRQINPNGLGLVYAERNDKPIFGIEEACDGRVRNIGLGCNGAYPKKIGDMVDFINDIRGQEASAAEEREEVLGLETLANEFLEACYQNAYSIRTRDIVYLVPTP